MEKYNSLWVLGHKVSFLEVSGDFDFVKGETPARIPGPPPHHHEKLDEIFMVTEGEMEFIVNGQPSIVRKGEIVDLPKGVVHTFSNKSDKPCHWINVHSPKGFWSFFSDMGVSVDEENALEKSVHKSVIEKVMAKAAEYDMIIDL